MTSIARGLGRRYDSGMSEPPEVDPDYPDAVYVEVSRTGVVTVAVHGEVVDEGDFEASVKEAVRRAEAKRDA